jgi:hypothetical protein
MSDARVIEIRSGMDIQDEDRPFVTADRPPFCTHKRTRLDAEAQRVYCRDCSREVPAFVVLQGFAREPERYIDHRKEAIRRAKVAEGNLAELERIEANAKARVRRAVSQIPACECGEDKRKHYRRLDWRFCPVCGGRAR